MMNYNAILKQLGDFGFYQKLCICLLTLPVFFDAGTTMMLVFILGSHDHRCRLPDITDTAYLEVPTRYSNSTVISSYNASQCFLTTNGTDTPCNEWVYDTTFYQSTLISKFNMVCEDKITRSHVLLGHFIGTFCNAILCGFLCDTWGRKPTLIFGISLLIIPNIIRPWIPWLYLVIICEFLNAMGSNLSYVVPFTLATELVDPAHRVLATFAINFSYCAGSFALLFFAYFIRNWETLILVVSSPIVVCFFIFIIVTESPRWLLIKGRTKEAMQIFQKTANINEKTINFDINNFETDEEKQISFLRSLRCMVKSRQMMARFCILFFNWFAISLIYFGISMNVGDLGGNVYVNYALSTCVETIAVVLCIWADRFPRKRIYCPAMLVGGGACLCTLFTSLYGDENIHWITILLAMVGKLGVTTSFFVIYLITSEVFPTGIRASMFGICSSAARVGSMSSSYIGKLGVLLDTKFGTALPLIIFGSVGTFAGLLSLLLPETRNIQLPESFEDAININRSEEIVERTVYSPEEKFVMIAVKDGSEDKSSIING